MPDIEDTVPTIDESPPPPPELPLEWAYSENSQPQDKGSADCVIEDKGLRFRCTSGPPFDVRYADVEAVEDAGVNIALMMRGGGRMELSKLARNRDMFRAALLEKWTHVNRRQALSEEKLLGSFEGRAGRGADTAKPAGIGIYETAVVLDFGSGEVARIPLIFSGRPMENNYTFTFSPPGERWSVGFMGRDTDLFRRTLEQAISALEARAQDRIRALCPGMPPFKLRALVSQFLDGLAVPVRTAQEASPALADAMGAELKAAGLHESWAACLELGTAEAARIGQKEALRSSEGAYRWFFVPVVRGGKAAVVMEASAEGSSGRATYVFRVPGGPDAVETAMDGLNYGLVMINFRREPIYMGEAQMKKPGNEHYLRSVERVPALAELRRNFMGRVSHSEAWKAKLQDILNTL